MLLVVSSVHRRGQGCTSPAGKIVYLSGEHVVYTQALKNPAPGKRLLLANINHVLFFQYLYEGT